MISLLVKESIAKRSFLSIWNALSPYHKDTHQPLPSHQPKESNLKSITQAYLDIPCTNQHSAVSPGLPNPRIECPPLKTFPPTNISPLHSSRISSLNLPDSCQSHLSIQSPPSHLTTTPLYSTLLHSPLRSSTLLEARPSPTSPCLILPRQTRPG